MTLVKNRNYYYTLVFAVILTARLWRILQLAEALTALWHEITEYLVLIKWGARQVLFIVSTAMLAFSCTRNSTNITNIITGILILVDGAMMLWYVKSVKLAIFSMIFSVILFVPMESKISRYCGIFCIKEEAELSVFQNV